MSIKNVVVLSGGMDSATVLGEVIAKYKKDNVFCIFFNYGQLTLEKEKECVANLCKFYGVDLVISKIDLISTGLTLGVDNDFEVIGRNPLLTLYTLNYVRNMIKDKSVKLNIWLGIQGSDSTDYPDCTKEVVFLLKELIRSLGNNDLCIPFLYNTKEQIIDRGMCLGVPYQFTWSCYTDSEKPCGVCPSCKLRAEAFKEAGFKDPIYG